ncbi:guanine nucleotide-binding protein G(I)/G(S)/G(O) subunit gamma-T2-like [Callorhinchus milii]|nr:guanine nucleotide-binding protein G(I)/G(S)/G(O) subunit gamma-T2-like [Callorhinchus milii]|eukprot:gi/632981453/ref/XP_007907600.1/ PREDICTED: guanine nucleotide-binding protein G(I)/G(S)/G(O) subunit gamma-T2-like [Callorhinchus milii]
MTDISEIDMLKMQVEQLRKELKAERGMVSKSATELKDWMESMAAEDMLLKGIPEDQNPFKEKGGCVLS